MFHTLNVKTMGNGWRKMKGGATLDLFNQFQIFKKKIEEGKKTKLKKLTSHL